VIFVSICSVFLRPFLRCRCTDQNSHFWEFWSAWSETIAYICPKEWFSSCCSRTQIYFSSKDCLETRDKVFGLVRSQREDSDRSVVLQKSSRVIHAKDFLDTFYSLFRENCTVAG
jgi:hypothetical protein